MIILPRSIILVIHALFSAIQRAGFGPGLNVSTNGMNLDQANTLGAVSPIIANGRVQLRSVAKEPMTITARMKRQAPPINP